MSLKRTIRKQVTEGISGQLSGVRSDCKYAPFYGIIGAEGSGDNGELGK